MVFVLISFYAVCICPAAHMCILLSPVVLVIVLILAGVVGNALMLVAQLLDFI